MSWQAYVDDQLVGTGKIQRAAIIGRQGGVWATSKGYNLSPEEQKAAINAFSDLDATRASGIRLHGQKYFTINATDGSVYGKKGADGCFLVRTTQAILVAEYVAPIQQGEAVPVVEGLGDYLRNAGY